MVKDGIDFTDTKSRLFICLPIAQGVGSFARFVICDIEAFIYVSIGCFFIDT